MRLVELSLLAYGGFTHRTLEFGRDSALHVVYGSNEAGKSTTLRALLGLFYGIDAKTSDDYRHAKGNLRIGATLRSEHGDELTVVRRKGTENALLAPDDKPVDERVLARMLGGLPKEVFRSMFGLDHARLREGGEQLRRGEGDLGESLFQAGTGGLDVHGLLQALGSELDAVFLPRGKRPLNEAIKAYGAVRKEIAEHTTRVELYREQQRKLEVARQRVAALRAARQELQLEQGRLQRVQRALPALSRRRVLLERKAALGPVRALAKGSADARRAAQAELLACERQAAHLDQQVAGLRERHAALVVRESLARLDKRVVLHVRDGLGKHRAAAKDLPKRRQEVAAQQGEAAVVLRKLGYSTTLAEVECLRVDLATTARIGRLARERSELNGRAAAANRDLEQVRHQLRVADADPSALAERVLEREQRVARQIEVLEDGGTPPTEAELRDARTARAAIWQEIRAAVTAGQAPPDAQLADHERLTRRADEIADRMRGDAHRASTLSRLRAEQASCAQNRERLLTVQAVQRERERLDESWGELMARLRLPRDAGVEEATATLEQLERLFSRVDEIQKLNARIEAMEGDEEELRQKVAALVATHLPEAASLGLDAAAEALLEHHEKARSALDERTRIEGELAQSEQRRESSSAQAQEARDTLDRLMQAAGVASLAELEAAERRSDEANELARGLSEIEDDLLQHGDGASIEQLIQEAQGQAADHVRLRLEDLRDEIETKSDELNTANYESLSLESGLERYGHDRAAEAALAAQLELSKIRGYVDEYVRKRLARDLLRRQIRRYREQNQGPLVASAGELFARLTLGHYSGLRVGYGDDDTPVLQCVVRDGSVPIRVDSLSEGARDQLYLALRLATLRQFCTRHEPLPLILDDVLITFDEPRTRAALAVLGELAETTQVLFFTHQERVLELAREAVPTTRLREHRLDDGRRRDPAVEPVSRPG